MNPFTMLVAGLAGLLVLGVVFVPGRVGDSIEQSGSGILGGVGRLANKNPDIFGALLFVFIIMFCIWLFKSGTGGHKS